MRGRAPPKGPPASVHLVALAGGLIRARLGALLLTVIKGETWGSRGLDMGPLAAAMSGVPVRSLRAPDRPTSLRTVPPT